jgi:hypothetical protein
MVSQVGFAICKLRLEEGEWVCPSAESALFFVGIAPQSAKAPLPMIGICARRIIDFPGALYANIGARTV